MSRTRKNLKKTRRKVRTVRRQGGAPPDRVFYLVQFEKKNRADRATENRRVNEIYYTLNADGAATATSVNEYLSVSAPEMFLTAADLYRAYTATAWTPPAVADRAVYTVLYASDTEAAVVFQNRELLHNPDLFRTWFTQWRSYLAPNPSETRESV